MRLKEDSSSWRASGILRRDFRHDPGLPEDEIPKHRKKKRKKHIHEYKKVEIGKSIERVYSLHPDGTRDWKNPTFHEVPKYQMICELCGNHKLGDHFFFWR